MGWCEQRADNVKIIVNTSRQILRIGVQEFACAIGKNGVVPQQDGREGDGKTPLGTYQIRYGLYRTDRIVLPPTKLVFWQIRRDDGWCDDPNDPAYNRPVRLPYLARVEKLWRESSIYDIIIVLSHNDNPPVSNMGSAVFLHIAREAYAPTEGCVAVSQTDMLRLISKLGKTKAIEILA